MPSPDSAELKRNLRAAGFEIYRSTSGQIHLAERVRDNLIMDSGIAAHFPKPAPRSEINHETDGVSENWQFVVQATVRAQASHFPGADTEQIWRHARALAEAFLNSNYAEVECKTESVTDPSDPNLSLDTSYEILLQRPLEGDFEQLHSELRAALSRPRSTSDD